MQHTQEYGSSSRTQCLRTRSLLLSTIQPHGRGERSRERSAERMRIMYGQPRRAPTTHVLPVPGSSRVVEERVAPEPDEQATVSSTTRGEPVSPELALVDPELAAELRRTLGISWPLTPGLHEGTHRPARDEAIARTTHPLPHTGVETRAVAPIGPAMVTRVRPEGDDGPLPTEPRGRSLTAYVAIAFAVLATLLVTAAAVRHDAAEATSQSPTNPIVQRPPAPKQRHPEALPTATRKPAPSLLHPYAPSPGHRLREPPRTRSSSSEAPSGCFSHARIRRSWCSARRGATQAERTDSRPGHIAGTSGP